MATVLDSNSNRGRVVVVAAVVTVVVLGLAVHSKNKQFGSTTKMNATVCINLF